MKEGEELQVRQKEYFRLKLAEAQRKAWENVSKIYLHRCMSSCREEYMESFMAEISDSPIYVINNSICHRYVTSKGYKTSGIVLRTASICAECCDNNIGVMQTFYLSMYNNMSVPTFDNLRILLDDGDVVNFMDTHYIPPLSFRSGNTLWAHTFGINSLLANITIEDMKSGHKSDYGSNSCRTIYKTIEIAIVFSDGRDVSEDIERHYKDIIEIMEEEYPGRNPRIAPADIKL